jgi:hypothetical protein
MEAELDIEPIKAELERAYARLRSIRAGEDSTGALEQIERLERELLTRHIAFVEERDSTLPPPRKL